MPCQIPRKNASSCMLRRGKWLMQWYLWPCDAFKRVGQLLDMDSKSPKHPIFASPRCWMPSKTETNLRGASSILSDLKQLWMIPFVSKIQQNAKVPVFLLGNLLALEGGAYYISYFSNVYHIYYSISNLHPSPSSRHLPSQNMLSKRCSTKGPTNSQ